MGVKFSTILTSPSGTLYYYYYYYYYLYIVIIIVYLIKRAAIMISRVVHLEMFEWPIPIKAARTPSLASSHSVSLSHFLSLSRSLSFSLSHTLTKPYLGLPKNKYILKRRTTSPTHVHTSPGRAHARFF